MQDSPYGGNAASIVADGSLVGVCSSKDMGKITIWESGGIQERVFDYPINRDWDLCMVLRFQRSNSLGVAVSIVSCGVEAWKVVTSWSRREVEGGALLSGSACYVDCRGHGHGMPRTIGGPMTRVSQTGSFCQILINFWFRSESGRISSAEPFRM